jgi:hypothetical protein
MTNNQSATRKIVALPAKTLSILRDQIRGGTGAAAPPDSSHEGDRSRKSGARAQPANWQWRTLAAMGGAAAIVMAMILSIGALLATRAVGLAR